MVVINCSRLHPAIYNSFTQDTHSYSTVLSPHSLSSHTGIIYTVHQLLSFYFRIQLMFNVLFYSISPISSIQSHLFLHFNNSHRYIYNNFTPASHHLYSSSVTITPLLPHPAYVLFNVPFYPISPISSIQSYLFLHFNNSHLSILQFVQVLICTTRHHTGITDFSVHTLTWYTQSQLSLDTHSESNNQPRSTADFGVQHTFYYSISSNYIQPLL